MDLVRFDPFSMFREFDRYVEGSLAPRAWAPRVDVIDLSDSILIRIDVAGIDPADIDLTLEGHTLKISGSRALDESAETATYHRREIFTGDFSRTLILPKGLAADEITASADNGLLEVAIPRKPEVLPRKVKIEAN